MRIVFYEFKLGQRLELLDVKRNAYLLQLGRVVEVLADVDVFVFCEDELAKCLREAQAAAAFLDGHVHGV